MGGVHAGTVVALLLLLAGCGSGSDAKLGAPTVTRSATVKSADGKSADVLVKVYRPAQASKIPPLPYTGRMKTSCRVTPATDVVIPISVKIVNRTPKLRPPLEFFLAADFSELAKASPYRANVDLVEGDLVPPGGLSICHVADEDFLQRLFLIEWREAPKTGEAATYDFFLVGHDYYSQKYPMGNPLYFKGFKLVPNLVFGLERDRALGTLRRTTPIPPMAVVPS
jgi:hypothetical protein